MVKIIIKISFKNNIAHQNMLWKLFLSCFYSDFIRYLKTSLNMHMIYVLQKSWNILYILNEF